MLDKHQRYVINKTILNKSFHLWDFFGQSEKIRMIDRRYTKKYITSEVALLLSNMNRYYSDKDNNEKESIPKTFFIFWWQVDNIPDLVINNIYLLSKYSNCEVVVITQQNIQKYVKNIPDEILEKVKTKQISLAHFSDILRTMLLFERGGIWIDATVMTLKDVDASIFDNNIFTPINLNRVDNYVPNGKWNINCLGSRRNNGAMKFVNEGLIHFALHYKKMPDYFTLDYLLDIAYTFNIGNFKHDLIQLGNNNPAYNELEDKLNLKYSEEDFSTLTSETTFFKTSWRKNYQNLTNSGELTYMGKIKSEENLQ